MVWKPTLDVIVSDCALKSFCFWHSINGILTISFCLTSLILPNHAFYISFG